MDRWLHATLYVVAGSLLGLAHPMVLLGPQVFTAVWSASLVGDAVFVAGMAAAYLLARRAQGWTALPAALVMVWLAYTLAWSITGPALGEGSASEAPMEVAVWGWPGLLVCGSWPWVQRTLEEKAARAERAQRALEAAEASGSEAPGEE